MFLTKKSESSFNFFYVSFFLLFLIKLSVSFGGDGLSGNYTFLFFPLFLILKNRFIKKSIFFNKFIIFYILIFFSASIYQFWYIDFFLRRFVSFALFLAVFSYCFFEIDDKMISSFKVALILISVFLSLSTIFTYINLGGANLGAAAKDAVGSQRYGFVYVLAFWVLLFERRKSFIIIALKYFCLFLIFIGILLTFSRSGLVAIFASGLIYLIKTFFSLVYQQKTRELIKLLFYFFLLFLSLLILLSVFPEVFQFFDSRLFIFFSNGGFEEMDLGNQEGSEGFRIYIFKLILNFVLHNPLTGSGFLGVWILFEDHSGSSHNQYTDLLFRTGFIGFLIYIYMLFKVSIYLYKFHSGLFWGFIGVFIYGLFHETFKESHGGFILAFVFGMYASFRRENSNSLESL